MITKTTNASNIISNTDLELFSHTSIHFDTSNLLIQYNHFDDYINFIANNTLIPTQANYYVNNDYSDQTIVENVSSLGELETDRLDCTKVTSEFGINENSKEHYVNLGCVNQNSNIHINVPDTSNIYIGDKLLRNYIFKVLANGRESNIDNFIITNPLINTNVRDEINSSSFERGLYYTNTINTNLITTQNIYENIGSLSEPELIFKSDSAVNINTTNIFFNNISINDIIIDIKRKVLPPVEIQNVENIKDHSFTITWNYHDTTDINESLQIFFYVYVKYLNDDLNYIGSSDFKINTNETQNENQSSDIQKSFTTNLNLLSYGNNNFFRNVDHQFFILSEGTIGGQDIEVEKLFEFNSSDFNFSNPGNVTSISTSYNLNNNTITFTITTLPETSFGNTTHVIYSYEIYDGSTRIENNNHDIHVVNGHYPLFLTNEDANNFFNSASPHNHYFNNITYYMPNDYTYNLHGGYTTRVFTKQIIKSDIDKIEAGVDYKIRIKTSNRYFSDNSFIYKTLRFFEPTSGLTINSVSLTNNTTITVSIINNIDTKSGVENGNNSTPDSINYGYDTTLNTIQFRYKKGSANYSSYTNYPFSTTSFTYSENPYLNSENANNVDYFFNFLVSSYFNSSFANVTESLKVTCPTQPILNTPVVNSDTQITLSWSASTFMSGSSGSYLLYANSLHNKTVTSNATTFNNPSNTYLASSYTFYVVAQSTGQNQSDSKTVNVASNFTDPGDPRNLSLSKLSGNNVQCSWTEPIKSSNGMPMSSPLTYILSFSNPNQTATVINTNSYSGFYTTGSTGNFTFTVQARNFYGYTSDIISKTQYLEYIVEPSGLNPPILRTITGNYSQLNLIWFAVTNEGTSSNRNYSYVLTNGGGSGSLSGTTPGTNILISGLRAGQSYIARIIMTYTGGDSGTLTSSDSSSVKVPSLSPGSFTVSIFSVTNSQVVFSWNRPNPLGDPAITGYNYGSLGNERYIYNNPAADNFTLNVETQGGIPNVNASETYTKNNYFTNPSTPDVDTELNADKTHVTLTLSTTNNGTKNGASLESGTFTYTYTITNSSSGATVTGTTTSNSVNVNISSLDYGTFTVSVSSTNGIYNSTTNGTTTFIRLFNFNNKAIFLGIGEVLNNSRWYIAWENKNGNNNGQANTEYANNSDALSLDYTPVYGLISPGQELENGGYYYMISTKAAFVIKATSETNGAYLGGSGGKGNQWIMTGPGINLNSHMRIWLNGSVPPYGDYFDVDSNYLSDLLVESSNFFHGILIYNNRLELYKNYVYNNLNINNFSKELIHTIYYPCGYFNSQYQIKSTNWQGNNIWEGIPAGVSALYVDTVNEFKDYHGQTHKTNPAMFFACTSAWATGNGGVFLNIVFKLNRSIQEQNHTYWAKKSSRLFAVTLRDVPETGIDTTNQFTKDLDNILKIFNNNIYHSGSTIYYDRSYQAARASNEFTKIKNYGDGNFYLFHLDGSTLSGFSFTNILNTNGSHRLHLWKPYIHNFTNDDAITFQKNIYYTTFLCFKEYGGDILGNEGYYAYSKPIRLDWILT